MNDSYIAMLIDLLETRVCNNDSVKHVVSNCNTWYMDGDKIRKHGSNDTINMSGLTLENHIKLYDELGMTKAVKRIRELTVNIGRLTAVPQPVFQQPATPQPTIPVIPQPAFPQPVVPKPSLVKPTNKSTVTLLNFKNAGWTDAQLVECGYATWITPPVTDTISFSILRKHDCLQYQIVSLVDEHHDNGVTSIDKAIELLQRIKREQYNGE